MGEITDEHDLEALEAIVNSDDNIWIMDGDVHLDEVHRAIEYDLPDTEVETIAGLLIEGLGALPTKGAIIAIELPIDPAELVSEKPVQRWLEAEVLEVERHVPSSVRLKLIEGAVVENDQ